MSAPRGTRPPGPRDPQPALHSTTRAGAREGGGGLAGSELTGKPCWMATPPLRCEPPPHRAPPAPCRRDRMVVCRASGRQASAGAWRQSCPPRLHARPPRRPGGPPPRRPPPPSPLGLGRQGGGARGRQGARRSPRSGAVVDALPLAERHQALLPTVPRGTWARGLGGEGGGGEGGGEEGGAELAVGCGGRRARMRTRVFRVLVGQGGTGAQRTPTPTLPRPTCRAPHHPPPLYAWPWVEHARAVLGGGPLPPPPAAPPPHAAAAYARQAAPGLVFCHHGGRRAQRGASGGWRGAWAAHASLLSVRCAGAGASLGCAGVVSARENWGVHWWWWW